MGILQVFFQAFLILLSVIMFLIGLVSEQIASLRFERPRE